MIYVISKILEVVGGVTLCLIIFSLTKHICKKIHFHRHSYQVHHIWRIYDKDRDCEKWDLHCKCEKCGKFKQITFWNDGLKLDVK